MSEPVKAPRRKPAHKMTIELSERQYETLRTANYITRRTRQDLVASAIDKQYEQYAPKNSPT